MRSLLQCFLAKVRGGGRETIGEIYCDAGHNLGTNHYLALSRGSPVELKVCQSCLDYDKMGEPVASKDRGWVRRR